MGSGVGCGVGWGVGSGEGADAAIVSIDVATSVTKLLKSELPNL